MRLISRTWSNIASGKRIWRQCKGLLPDITIIIIILVVEILHSWAEAGAEAMEDFVVEEGTSTTITVKTLIIINVPVSCYAVNDVEHAALLKQFGRLRGLKCVRQLFLQELDYAVLAPTFVRLKKGSLDFRMIYDIDM